MTRTAIRSRLRHALALPGAAILAFASVAAVHADDGVERREKIRVLWSAGDSRDEIVLEELDLAPGETRDVTTESGKSATITRDDDGDGMTLEIEGKEIRIGGEDEIGAHPGHRILVRKRVGGEDGAETIVLGEGEAGGPHRFERKVVVDGDGETKSFVVMGGGEGDGERDVVFLRGEPGEHGFAFKSGGGPLLLPHEHLLAQIEKSEKFLALDPATQEIVREVVRDAQPKMKVRRVAPEGLGAAGDGERVQVWVEREVEEKDEN